MTLDVVAALGEFLRARRARLRPADVGLSAGGGRRRTAGLRREELAALAGISIDYCIRLEQGKYTNPSPEVLDALASALLLNAEEREHLHTLARPTLGKHDQRQSDGQPKPHRRQTVSPGIRQLLEKLRPCPAYVLNPISDVLAANPEAIALFAGLDDWPPHRRNTARYTFLHPAAQELLVDWPHSAATTAANLRALAAEASDTPGLADLIDELRTNSSQFDKLWQRYDVRRRRGEPKSFRHPKVGDITLSYEVLRLEQGQRMSLYQAAPDSPDQDALSLLAMLTAETPEPR